MVRGCGNVQKVCEGPTTEEAWAGVCICKL